MRKTFFLLITFSLAISVAFATKPGSMYYPDELYKEPILKSQGGKVEMVMYMDFQGPFSGRFYRDTFPLLQQEYKTNEVKYIFVNFPLSQLHPNAQIAAIAGECANRQNKFWPYAEKLYNNQSALDKESLKLYAEEIKLNMKKFNECLDSPETEAEVDSDYDYGRQLGITGIPTFYINGIKVVGAHPFSYFKQLIDEELS